MDNVRELFETRLNVIPTFSNELGLVDARSAGLLCGDAERRFSRDARAAGPAGSLVGTVGAEQRLPVELCAGVSRR